MKKAMAQSPRRKAVPLSPMSLSEVGVIAGTSLNGLKLSTGKVRYFSLMPVRLVRRPMAKYIILINIRL